jgi:hypothetical protein
MPDGRTYRAEIWQLETSFHMTIFVPRLEGEGADQATKAIEEALIEFCGKRYQRTEPVVSNGLPCWSYNVVLCDAQHQYVSRLPLAGLGSFSIWAGERQVTFATRNDALST